MSFAVRSFFPPLLRRFGLGLLFLSALGTALDAQSNKEPIQLRTFIPNQQQQTPPTVAFLNPDQNLVPLTVTPGNLSDPLTVAGGGTLPIYLLTDLQGALAQKDGKLPKPMAELPLVQNCQRYILVLQPGKEAADWSYSLVPDDAASFPGGGFLIFNLTSFPLSGQIGEQEVQLAPRKDSLFQPTVDAANPGVSVLFQTIQGGQPRPFLRQRWTLNPAMRNIIVFWDFGGGDIRTFIVSDNAPPSLTASETP